MMGYSPMGLKLTQSFESCRLSSYQDSKGIWTIGYGHTYGIGPAMSCTSEQASEWLMQDIAVAVQNVNDLLAVPVSQEEFDALVDFSFNCGSHALAMSALLRLLNAGNIEGAANQFALWDHCGGTVVAGLLRRRLAEKAKFESGEAS